ncbi:MAG: cation diffusion facilitator family transporter [Bacteroidota bacterium]
MKAAQKNIRIQKWVAILSVVLLVTKLSAYYITHSVAILTDALESIVNVVAGFFGLYSLHLSAKPHDEDHPYGHGKIEFISAAVEGSLITVAGLMILYESIRGLIIPRDIEKLDLGIMLVGVTALVNFAVGSICVKTGRKNHSQALIASGSHLLSDTYSTVGILVGLALIYATGILWIDSAVGMLFSVIILRTGYVIVRTSVAGIMDEQDKAVLIRAVEVLDKNRSNNWVDLHNLRIIKYGSQLHIDGHLTVPWYLNVNETNAEIDNLSGIVRKEFENSIELFLHSDGCVPSSCPICIKDDCPVRQHTFQRRITWNDQNVQQDEKHQINTE